MQHTKHNTWITQPKTKHSFTGLHPHLVSFSTQHLSHTPFTRASKCPFIWVLCNRQTLWFYPAKYPSDKPCSVDHWVSWPPSAFDSSCVFVCIAEVLLPFLAVVSLFPVRRKKKSEFNAVYKYRVFRDNIWCVCYKDVDNAECAYCKIPTNLNLSLSSSFFLAIFSALW